MKKNFAIWITIDKEKDCNGFWMGVDKKTFERFLQLCQIGHNANNEIEIIDDGYSKRYYVNNIYMAEESKIIEFE